MKNRQLEKSMTDKIIWITGASSGIGEALTRAYAQRSVTIIISSRSEHELKRVQDSLKNCPAKIIVLPLDLEKYEELPAKVTQALTHVPHIDLLINNGGISQRSLAKDTIISVDQRLMTVNYLGTVALTKAILPHMIKRKSGHIATVTSLVGKFGTPLRSSYSAAKHALHGFFDSLRAELYLDNIQVSLVCPGFIKTNVSLNALTADGKKQEKMDETTGQGMEPSVFAHKMMAALDAGKEEVYIGGKERFGVYLKRFFPCLFSRILRKAKVA